MTVQFAMGQALIQRLPRLADLLAAGVQSSVELSIAKLRSEERSDVVSAMITNKLDNDISIVLRVSRKSAISIIRELDLQPPPGQ